MKTAPRRSGIPLLRNTLGRPQLGFAGWASESEACTPNIETSRFETCKPTKAPGNPTSYLNDLCG